MLRRERIRRGPSRKAVWLDQGRVVGRPRFRWFGAVQGGHPRVETGPHNVVEQPSLGNVTKRASAWRHGSLLSKGLWRGCEAMSDRLALDLRPSSRLGRVVNGLTCQAILPAGPFRKPGTSIARLGFQIALLFYLAIFSVRQRRSARSSRCPCGSGQRLGRCSPACTPSLLASVHSFGMTDRQRNAVSLDARTHSRSASRCDLPVSV